MQNKNNKLKIVESMISITFGDRSIHEIYKELIKIGFQDDESVKYCSFGIALLTPLFKKQTFLSEVQIPPSSGNMVVSISIDEEEASMLTNLSELQHQE